MQHELTIKKYGQMKYINSTGNSQSDKKNPRPNFLQGNDQGKNESTRKLIHK